MKLSVLLLAHKNLNQVKRLLKKLYHKDVDIFVHLDKKFKLSDKEIKEIANCTSNIHILPERFSVNIVDSSVTKCILISLKYIADSQSLNGGGYVALLSGQDYLLKPIDELIRFLEKNYPKAFIDCTPYSTSNWIFHKFSHTPFYGKWYGTFYQRKGLIGKAGRYLIRKIDKFLLKFSPDMHSRLSKYNINLFGGSQWWILPFKMVEEILDITNKRDDMVKNLYNCIPDEIFFQTLGMQTSFAPLIDINPPEQISQNSLTYSNFTAPGKPFCGHPHIITCEDWAWLYKKPQYIARKFDMSLDKKIFDIIDNEHKQAIY